MQFRLWLESIENQISSDFDKVWYHGTWDLQSVLRDGRLKTRSEGARARNAAAMGIGVYLTDNLEEAQAYVPAGRDGGVVSVRFVKRPKLLRLGNTPEDDETFEKLREIGLENPMKVNQMIASMGCIGLHWDLRTGEQKIALYDPSFLSNVQLAARSVTAPGTLDRTWELE